MDVWFDSGTSWAGVAQARSTEQVGSQAVRRQNQPTNLSLSLSPPHSPPSPFTSLSPPAPRYPRLPSLTPLSHYHPTPLLIPSTPLPLLD